VFDFKREIGISHFGVFECYAKCGVNSYLCWANQQHQYSTHKHLDLENQVIFKSVYFDALSLHKPTTHKKTQPNKVVAIALLTRGIVRLRVGEDWNVVCSLLRWFGYTGIRDFVFDFKREIGISHFGVFECYAKCGVNSYLCWANQQHQYSTHKHLDLENQVIFKSVYFGVCSFFLFTNQQHTKKHNQTKLSPLRF
jgi:hypothetical protein